MGVSGGISGPKTLKATWNIPGSFRYVKFLPLGGFFWVKRHNFYTLGRSRYTILCDEHLLHSCFGSWRDASSLANFAGEFHALFVASIYSCEFSEEFYHDRPSMEKWSTSIALSTEPFFFRDAAFSLVFTWIHIYTYLDEIARNCFTPFIRIYRSDVKIFFSRQKWGLEMKPLV